MTVVISVLDVAHPVRRVHVPPRARAGRRAWNKEAAQPCGGRPKSREETPKKGMRPEAPSRYVRCGPVMAPGDAHGSVPPGHPGRGACGRGLPHSAPQTDLRATIDSAQVAAGAGFVSRAAAAPARRSPLHGGAAEPSPIPCMRVAEATFRSVSPTPYRGPAHYVGSR